MVGRGQAFAILFGVPDERTLGEPGHEQGETGPPSEQRRGPDLWFWLSQAAHDRAGDSLRGLDELPGGVDLAWLAAPDRGAHFKELGVGGDGVDTGDVDLIECQLDAKAHGERVLGGLGGTVGGMIGQADAADDAGDDEDVAGALLLHDGDDAAHAADGAPVIGLEDAAVGIVGGGVDGVEESVAGVGEHGVDSAERFEGAVGELGDVIVAGNIGGNDERFAAGGMDLIGDGLESIGASGGEDDFHAGFGGLDGGGGTNAGRRAGDHDDFAVELTRHARSIVSVCRWMGKGRAGDVGGVGLGSRRGMWNVV